MSWHKVFSALWPIIIAIVALAWLAFLFHSAPARARSGNAWFVAGEAPTPTPVNIPLSWAGSSKFYLPFDVNGASQGTCGSNCDQTNNEGTPLSSISTTSGIVSQAVTLGANSDLVSSGSGSWSPANGSALTITGYMKPITTDSGTTYFMDGQTSSTQGFELTRGAAQDRLILDWGNPNRSSSVAPNSASLNQWYFFACVIDGASQCFAYPLNASTSRLSSGTSSSATWVASTDKLWLGSTSGGASEQPVIFDDVALWSGIALGPQSLCRLCSCAVNGYDEDGDGGLDVGDGLCGACLLGGTGCTGSGTPAACCTGSGTGTCDGTQYSDPGINDLCDNFCTLPACNSSGPSTS